jgi:LL-diaminopimelate aminotransferase
LGWAVGRPDRIAALARVKNYIDTGAFLAVQAAGAEVLKQAERIAGDYAARFKERRDGLLPVLRANGFEVETPRATLYLWVPLPEGLASAAFQKRALEDVGVVTLPGSAFGAGAEGFFRIALTVPTPRLIEATERLGKVLATV